MNRNILITFNALFCALSLWLLTVRVTLPFINAAQAIGFSDALSLLGAGSAIFFIAPCLFGWLLINMLHRRWSVVLYVGSYALLVLSALLLAVGVISFIQGQESGLAPMLTLVVAALLSATAWFNGRMLKAFKVAG